MDDLYPGGAKHGRKGAPPREPQTDAVSRGKCIGVREVDASKVYHENALPESLRGKQADIMAGGHSLLVDNFSDREKPFRGRIHVPEPVRSEPLPRGRICPQHMANGFVPPRSTSPSPSSPDNGHRARREQEIKAIESQSSIMDKLTQQAAPGFSRKVDREVYKSVLGGSDGDGPPGFSTLSKEAPPKPSGRTRGGPMHATGYNVISNVPNTNSTNQSSPQGKAYHVAGYDMRSQSTEPGDTSSMNPKRGRIPLISQVPYATS